MVEFAARSVTNTERRSPPLIEPSGDAPRAAPGCLGDGRATGAHHQALIERLRVSHRRPRCPTMARTNFRTQSSGLRQMRRLKARMQRSLRDRLDGIEKLESELTRKAQKSLPGGPMYRTDMFLMGAMQRTLAQSRGFRQLIEARNFPSATILLRTQVDTAMRVNGLSLMDNLEENLQRLIEDKLNFNQLMSGLPKNGGKRERLTDAYLRKQLSAKYSWIDKIYTDASDFMHLSFRHLWTAIAGTDDETGMVYVAITGADPARDESIYFEVCDAFFEVSRITSIMILAMFMVVHRSERVSPTAAR
jgi:hypothetical protein